MKARVEFTHGRLVSRCAALGFAHFSPMVLFRSGKCLPVNVAIPRLSENALFSLTPIVKVDHCHAVIAPTLERCAPSRRPSKDGQFIGRGVPGRPVEPRTTSRIGSVRCRVVPVRGDRRSETASLAISEIG